VGLDAVIFDWGGTLTAWHTIDGAQLSSAVCEPHFPAPEAATFAAALYAVESQLWRAALDSQRSATLAAVFELAGVVASGELIASYLSAWEPHTSPTPMSQLLRHLRGRGIKVGARSNTMWPRERTKTCCAVTACSTSSTAPSIAARSTGPSRTRRRSGRDWTRCGFVADRPFDDVHCAQRVGMRTVLMPHSDVPAYAEVAPDAVISRLAELRPLIESWRAHADGSLTSIASLSGGYGSGSLRPIPDYNMRIVS
jgi:putative hydrolase of the HAD superfamily